MFLYSNTLAGSEKKKNLIQFGIGVVGTYLKKEKNDLIQPQHVCICPEEIGCVAIDYEF